MNNVSRRLRYVTLATGAAALAALVVTGVSPHPDGESETRGGSPVSRPAATAPPKAKPKTQPKTKPKTQVIHVEANLRVGEELDLGAPGRSVGDQFVFSGNLLSTVPPEDRVVGRFGGFCVITDTTRNAGQCQLTAVLPQGQITVQGEQTGIPTPGATANAITGGTKKFREAHGQMRLRVLTPATWDLTFEVIGH